MFLADLLSPTWMVYPLEAILSNMMEVVQIRGNEPKLTKRRCVTMKSNLRRIGIIRLSLLFWAFIATGGSAFGQVKSQPFTLTISSDQPAVTAGSDIFIRITQRNISSSIVDCSSWDVDSTDLSFNYDVRNEAGILMKQREGMANRPGSQKSCSLQPGGALSHNIWISWLYNLRILVSIPFECLDILITPLQRKLLQMLSSLPCSRRNESDMRFLG